MMLKVSTMFAPVCFWILSMASSCRPSPSLPSFACSTVESRTSPSRLRGLPLDGGIPSGAIIGCLLIESRDEPPKPDYLFHVVGLDRPLEVFEKRGTPLADGDDRFRILAVYSYRMGGTHKFSTSVSC